MTERAVTYCRLCSPLCGIEVEIDDGRVTKVTGDVEHPLTRGFTCSKGRRLGELHSDPTRFLTSQRRTAAGALEPVEVDVAIAEIATRLRAIVDEHGPDAVALFVGTQSYTASLTFGFMGAWFRALGSRKRFSTMTIDQSAKTVATGRLGSWAGGRQRFADADVWLLAGTNPLVSMQGGELSGFPIHDGLRRLEEARARGLRLLVVDPRRSEVAAHADLHLQLRPGTDAALFACLLHVVLRDGLVDRAFCDRWVSGLDALRAAVAGAAPDAMSEVTGVPAAQLVEAAHLFARASSGLAVSGTGPDMGPHANAAEHLIQALNVVCGRFPRAGDRPAGGGVLRGSRVFRDNAVSPLRSWDRGYRSRFGVGLLGGELPSPTLPAEILEDGPDRVRALVVAGGNPAMAFPDQDLIVEALAKLDLLVAVEPFPTETARLAHYVVAPAMALERPDDTRGYEHLFDEPFAQYTPAVLPKPPGVIEDWEVFFRLAAAMDLTLIVGSQVYEPGDPAPTSDELLEARAVHSSVPHAVVRRHPHGKVFDDVAPALVQPAEPSASGRLELLPDDVADEVAAALAAGTAPRSAARPFLLTVRRVRDTLNSLGRRSHNPCFVHPDDLAALGLPDGATVSITSDHGSISAVVQADDTMRPGAVSMTHCHGVLPGDDADPLVAGSSTSRLLRLDLDAQSISRMPWMTAIPVAIAPSERPLGATAQS